MIDSMVDSLIGSASQKRVHSKSQKRDRSKSQNWEYYRFWNYPKIGYITAFSVATTEQWKDKTTGERKQLTEWHRITASNKLGGDCPEVPQKRWQGVCRGQLANKEMERPKWCRSGDSRSSGGCFAIALKI